MAETLTKSVPCTERHRLQRELSLAIVVTSKLERNSAYSERLEIAWAKQLLAWNDLHEHIRQHGCRISVVDFTWGDAFGQ